MIRLFLLLALLAAAPASAQTRLELETRVASLRTRLAALEDSVAAAPARSPEREEFLDAQSRAERQLEAARSQLADAEVNTPPPAVDPLADGSPVDIPAGGASPVVAPTDSAPVVVETPMSPLVLGIFATLGTILVGVGVWVMVQRKRQQVPAGLASMVARGPSRLPLTGAAITAAEGSPFVQRGPFDALEREVRTLRRELDEARAWISEEHRSRQAAAAAPPASTAVRAQPAPAASPADAVAATFAEWCRRATPMMGKVDFFGNALASAVPDAHVQTVYRDLNSQAEPIRFDSRGGASPAEFWLVTVGSDALLFPQPLTGTQFRDLTRVFEGQAMPQALGQIAPARVRDEGAAFVLVQPGRVS